MNEIPPRMRKVTRWPYAPISKLPPELPTPNPASIANEMIRINNGIWYYLNIFENPYQVQR
jgi:hypothetical protein